MRKDRWSLNFFCMKKTFIIVVALFFTTFLYSQSGYKNLGEVRMDVLTSNSISLQGLYSCETMLIKGSRCYILSINEDVSAETSVKAYLNSFDSEIISIEGTITKDDLVILEIKKNMTAGVFRDVFGSGFVIYPTIFVE